MAYRKIEELSRDDVTIKVHYESSLREYRARVYIGGKAQEDSDAFDTDKESILGTARAMLERLVNPVQPEVKVEDVAATDSIALIQASPTPRKRPRGFYAQPSKLLAGLLSRA